METLELVLGLLSNLSVIARDPALGVRDRAVTSMLTLVTLARSGTEGLAALKTLSEEVQKMAQEGRQPTPEEWDKMKERSDAAHAAIQNFKPAGDEHGLVP